MSQEFEDVFGGEATSATAAHEAGHALVAWLSPAIGTVTGTTWVREGTSSMVRVGLVHKTPATAYTVWEILAVSAAGMAAEVITHGRFRTKECRTDLVAMRLAATNLSRGGKVVPVAPWDRPPSGTPVPPFRKYFREPPEPLVADLMGWAYVRAHALILGQRGAYERLRTRLIVKMVLTGIEIGEALALPKG